MVKPVKAARPKPPSALKIFSRRHLEKYQADLWVWGTITLLLAVIACLLAARVVLTSHHIGSLAFDRGQRAFIQVANGYVDGNVRHTQGGARPIAPVSPKADEHPGAAVTPSQPVEPVSHGPELSVPPVSSAALPPAPLAKLAEQTERGLMPVIGKDGTLPWKYYARPHPVTGKKPLVALVLTGLGLSKPRTEEALTLAQDFALSFSPYAGDARKWAQAAREKGFETLVDLPMQSVDFTRNGIDPGPHGLMLDAGDAENSDRTAWVMSRFSGYVGLLAPADENITGNAAVIRPVLTELAGHGVLFVYVKSPRNADLAKMAAERQFNALGIDTILDDDTSPGAIAKQLDRLAALAKSQGTAIGMAHAYPPTLAALAHWRDELSAQGIELVPISTLALKASQ